MPLDATRTPLETTIATKPIHDLGWLKTRVSAEKLPILLSQSVGKDPAWGADYIEQVMRGNLPASKRLVLAIRKLTTKLTRRVIPPAGTWVPFKSRSEQRSVLRRLTGEQRRKALLSAAFKSATRGGTKRAHSHPVRRSKRRAKAGRQRRR